MRHLFGFLLGLLSACIGCSLGREELSRMRVLEGFLELTVHVRYEISSFLTKRSELFCRFENDELSSLGFLSALRTAQKLGEDNPLYAALSECSGRLSLSKEDLRVLTEWARRLGETDVSEEVRRAEQTHALLSESYEKQRAGAYQKVRLYRAIGIVACLCIWLLLW